MVNLRGGRAGIPASLGRGVGTDVPGSGGEGVKQLGVACTGLTLAPATEVAATRDEEPCQDNGEDGRQPGAEGRPVDIDKTEPVVGLVQLDVVRLIGGGVVDGEREDSSSMSMAGAGVEVPLASRYASTSCSILIRLKMASPELNKKGDMMDE